MKTGLVIVDAWSVTEDLYKYGHKMHNDIIPKWSLEVRDNIKNFCNFLNYVCDIERKKGTTIIHSLGVVNNKLLNIKKDEASELTVDKKDKITFSTKLGKTIYENNIDEVYFCGFHFGKCIQNHIVDSNIFLINTNKEQCKRNRNIVLNLSMILPPPLNSETKKWDNNWRKSIDEKRFNHFMWSPWRFDKILGNN